MKRILIILFIGISCNLSFGQSDSDFNKPIKETIGFALIISDNSKFYNDNPSVPLILGFEFIGVQDDEVLTMGVVVMENLKSLPNEYFLKLGYGKFMEFKNSDFTVGLGADLIYSIDNFQFKRLVPFVILKIDHIYLNASTNNTVSIGFIF